MILIAISILAICVIVYISMSHFNKGYKRMESETAFYRGKNRELTDELSKANQVIQTAISVLDKGV
jgi:flagellar hook-basal body complex protein FliE